MSKIFISYRRMDSADISGRIYDRLVAHFGEPAIFKDVNSIPYGVNFKRYLEDMVNQCAVELVIIGRQWLDVTNEFGYRRLDDPADFVRIEVEAALRRDIPVIPLLVQGANMPKEKYLPPSLAELSYRNGTTVRPDPDFHHDMNRLIIALEKWLSMPAKPAASITVSVPDAAIVASAGLVEPMPVPIKRKEGGLHERETLPSISSENRRKLRSPVEDETVPIRLENPRKAPHIPHGTTPLIDIEWCAIPAGRITLESRSFRAGLEEKIVEVASYQISKFPITNRQFQDFVDANNGYINPEWWDFSSHAQAWYKGHRHPQPPSFLGDNFPRENVSWYEAMAYTQWLANKLKMHISLPTEAQWQRAAQGDDGRLYPWGNIFNPNKCNVEESGIGRTTPVNTHPGSMSPFHVADMFGNIQEWCLNTYNPDDKANSESERVVRGGAWKLKHAPLTYRFRQLPSLRLNHVGLRVVTEMLEPQPASRASRVRH